MDEKKEAFDLENFPTSESAKRMLSYVSEDFYEKSYVGKWIFQVMGMEYDEAKKIVEELPYQAFIETATWGLLYHEIKWHLPIRNNLSYEERRKLIYQKRDYRAPMTPYRMESLLSDLSGCKIHVNDIHDRGEDGYVPEHPNVFRVTIEDGNNSVNLTDVMQELRKLKQSHTTFTFHITTAVQICIGVKPEAYKVVHRLSGTFPKVSAGWKTATSEIDIDVSTDGLKVESPLSGASGETGKYPRTNIGYKKVIDVINAKATGEGNRAEYVVAGTKPKTSVGAKGSANSLVPGVTTENFKVTYPLCGSTFEI